MTNTRRSTWTVYDDLLILDSQDDEHIRQLSLELWATVYRHEYEDQLRRFISGNGRIWRILDGEEFFDGCRKETIYDLAHRHAAEVAGCTAIKGTAASWGTIRKQIWERDGPVCQVCEAPIEQGAWECGHMVDRMCGGSDRQTNLVVMCSLCNSLKPPHRTKEEYQAWLADGAVVGLFVKALKALDGHP